MGIEPTWTRSSPTPVLKTGTATRHADASPVAVGADRRRDPTQNPWSGGVLGLYGRAGRQAPWLTVTDREAPGR
jgi:hypothetical protein